MQPQDYKITYLDPGKQPYFDQNQNQWVNVLFEGFQNEPIKWVVKDLSKYHVGDTVYGHLETVTSQAGKPYLRFKRDQREDGQQRSFGSASITPGVASSKTATSQDDATRESINRSVALKAAVDFMGTEQKNNYDIKGVIKAANEFLAWLNNSGTIASREGAQSSPISSQAIGNRQSAVGQTYQPDPVDTYQRVAQAEYQPDNYDPNELPPDWP